MRHKSAIWRIKWNENGSDTLLASVSFDGSIKIWKLENEARELVNIYEKPGKTSQNGLDWAPARMPLLGAVSSAGEITMIYLKETYWEYLVKASTAPTVLTSICWAPTCVQQTLSLGESKHYFAYVGCDKVLNISYFDPTEESIVEVFAVKECHANWVRDVSWSSASLPNMQLIATASEDKSFKVWKVDLADNKATSESVVLSSPVWRVSWNFTGNLLAVATTSSEGSNVVQIFRESDKQQWELFSQLT